MPTYVVTLPDFVSGSNREALKTVEVVADFVESDEIHLIFSYENSMVAVFAPGQWLYVVKKP